MEASDFGGWLARQLVTHGYRSQRAFARAIDMDPTYLSRIINGHVARPERETLERIAYGLRLPFGEIAREAGALPELPAAVMPPQLALPDAGEPTGDQPWDRRKLIEWVEAHPDEQFRAGLAEDAEAMAPEEYEEYVFAIARAWLANGKLAQRIARLTRPPRRPANHTP